MPYGYLQTKNNVAKQLKELNRDYYGRKTWSQLYGSVDMAEQSYISSLTQDYAKDVSDAYASSFRQMGAINNSSLGQGFKEDAIADLDLALSEAYDSYRRNYLSNVSTVQQNSEEARLQIDNTLLQEAENYSNLQNSIYPYLQQLYDRSQGLNDYELDLNLQKRFNEDPSWSKYLVDVKDEEDNVVSKRLMTEQELYERNFDMDANGSGMINKSGIDFYDQMLNQLSQEHEGYGYYEWLSKENPELYDWALSKNNYNYTESGTNLGTFKTLMGIQSTDDEYKFIERFGGLKQDEVDAMFNKFTSKIEDLQSKISTDHANLKDDVIEPVRELTKEVRTVANELGIQDEVESALGMSWEEFENILTEQSVNYVTNLESFGHFAGSTVAAGAAGAAVGGKIGSSLGSGVGALAGTVAGTAVAPGAGTAAGASGGAASGATIGGTAGAIIGAVISVFGNILSYSNYSSKQQVDNKTLAQSSVDAYNNLLIALLSVANKNNSTK